MHLLCQILILKCIGTGSNGFTCGEWRYWPWSSRSVLYGRKRMRFYPKVACKCKMVSSLDRSIAREDDQRSSNPSLNPPSSPTSNPTSSPTAKPTTNPSKRPTAEDFIVKVKAFHGEPKDVLDASKLQDQPDVDAEFFGFEHKLTPFTRRLLSRFYDVGEQGFGREEQNFETR